MSDDSSLGMRLESLPRKVSVPLRELLVIGQVSEDAVCTVLDAAELAGDARRVLGFLAGYFYLHSQGVPVKDVISMAREQGRRVRLDWSAKKWQAEHERLSRAVTLKRLSEENIRYDLASFTTRLPGRFSGYLIRTSRRLGMEGLRQRHCVAGYHSQIQAGYCAIASLFIEGERWTVQLALAQGKKAALRLVQARGRYNKAATAKVIAAINCALGIEPEASGSVEKARERQPRVYMQNLRHMLPVLRMHGVHKVTVRFDGVGDSGSIDEVTYGDAQIEPSAIFVDVEVLKPIFEDGGWISTRAVEQRDLNAAIEALTDDYLDDTGVDWYNEDGGFGELVIDVDEGTVSLEVQVRRTESSTEYIAIRDIATGEDIG